MKKFKSRKKIRTKKILRLVHFLLILLFLNIIINSNLVRNESFINFLLNSATSSYDFNIDLLNPQKILKKTILYNNNLKKESKVDVIINEEPLVYIYNSHQAETYSSKYMEEYNILPDVLMASNMLKEKLESLNITTLVENSNILEYMKKNNMNHSQSYKASRYFLNKVINTNTSIKLYIDLHRDAAKHKTTYINIDNMDYAKIMFVIGLEYDTYEANLKVATKLNNIIEKKYPGISRGIMKKKGNNVNGIYNQDLNSNIILIEVGGNENSIEEVNNTLDALAIAIGEYLYENI